MITIDAKDQSLGRVASQVAKILLGKTAADFAKNVVAPVKVTVQNASKVKLTGSKVRTKEYVRYSGYPGGQKIENYETLTNRRGHKEAFRKAVLGMLPKNRLRAERIKLLTIEE